MSRQTITFVLDTERDRDICRWLAVQDNKSAAIREAIRTQLERGSISLADVYNAVLDLRRGTLALSSHAQAHGLAESDEPLDVATALDNLGL
jgi:hypothetical protein